MRLPPTWRGLRTVGLYCKKSSVVSLIAFLDVETHIANSGVMINIGGSSG